MELEVGENSTFQWMEEANITSKGSGNLGSVFSANRIFSLAVFCEHYWTPLLCFVGTLGNCLSVAVFCSNANQRSLSSSYYLSSLAISDTIYLVTLFVFWLEPVGVGVLSSNVGCPFIMYSGQVTCFLSVWLTVAFTVERFVSVISPLRRSSVCTVSKAKKIILSLTAFALLAFSYTLVIAQVVETGIRSDDYFEQNGNEATTLSPNNSSTSDYVIEGNLTRANLTPLQFMNNSQSWNSSFGMNCFGLEGVLLENCQSHLVDGMTTDSLFLDNLPNQGVDPLAPASTRLSHPYPIDDDGREKELGISLDMFNSTMDINLNGTDKNDEKEEPVYSKHSLCTVPRKYIAFSIIANYLDSIITLIIPFCLITYFNCRIAICIWKLKDERKQMVARVRMVNPRPSKRLSKNRKSKRLTGYFTKTLSPPGVQENFQGACTANQSCNHKPPANGDTKESVPNLVEKSKEAPISSLKQSHEVNKKENKSSSRSQSQAEFHGLKSTENSSLRPCNEEGMNICSGCNSPLTSQTPTRLKSLKSHTINTVNVVRKGNFRGGGCNNTSSPTSTHSSEARITKMLLLVSTVFIILNLPSHAIRLTVFFQSVLWEVDIETQARLHAMQQLSNVLLFNLNFAINFILYSLSGRNFRKLCLNVLFGRCHKKSGPSSKYKGNTTALRRTDRFGPKGEEDAKDGTELVDMRNNQLHDKTRVVEINLETVELDSTIE